MKKFLFLFVLFSSIISFFSGCSSSVEYKEVTPDPDTTAPADVTDYNLEVKETGILVTWTDAEDEDILGYQITWSSDSVSSSSGRSASIDEGAILVAQGSQKYFITQLTDGTYTVAVKTVDWSGNKSEGVSDSVEYTASVIPGQDTTPPADVTNLSAAAEDDGILITWTDATDEDILGYEVSWNQSGSISGRSAAVSENAVLVSQGSGSYFVAKVTDGVTYTFTVKSVDTSGNKSSGKTASAKYIAPVVPAPDTTPPADVTNLTAENYKSGISLTWTDATDEDVAGFEVTWDKSGIIGRSAYISSNSILVAPGNGGIFIGNLTDKDTYTFTVKSIDLCGNQSAGVSVSKEYEAELINMLVISLSPSTVEKTYDPVTITVSVSDDENSSVQLYYLNESSYDVSDVFARGTKIYGKAFDVSKNGVYTVAAKDNVGRVDRKIIEIKNIAVVTTMQPGDILMDDGSYLTPADYKTYAGTAKAVAVCGGFNDMDVPIGIGLVNTSTTGTQKGDAWSGSNNFEHPGIIVSRTTDVSSVPAGSKYYTYTYNGTTYYLYGDLEGEDNWDTVCEENPEAADKVADNYRVFNFALHYAETAALTGTDYENGWFIPSLNQLLEISKNYTVVNASLELCGASKIGQNYFTSSSSPAMEYEGKQCTLLAQTWFVNMPSGNFYPVDKNSGKFYLAVRYFHQD